MPHPYNNASLNRKAGAPGYGPRRIGDDEVCMPRKREAPCAPQRAVRGKGLSPFGRSRRWGRACA